MDKQFLQGSLFIIEMSLLCIENKNYCQTQFSSSLKKE